jgi:hypothetical protein
MSNFVPKNWKRRSRKVGPEQRAKNQRSAKRLKRLSLPITPEQIRAFTKCLVAVPSASGDECWFYLGSSKDTTVLTFNGSRYANRKHNGENIGPHQFALAGSLGVTVAALAGFDTHHASELGRCFGYRCCNPDHLAMREKRAHARSSKEENSVISAFVATRHSKMVRSLVYDTAPRERRPVEFQMVTGAATLRRSFAGVPFLIRTAQWLDVIDVDSTRQC